MPPITPPTERASAATGSRAHDPDVPAGMRDGGPAAAEREALTAALEAEPNFRLAEFDTPFLETDAARPARLQLEFMHAEARLTAWRVVSTVVVFGSARVCPPAVARTELAAAEAAAGGSPGDPLAARALERARRRSEYARWYDEARQLARLLSTGQQDPACRELVVVTGGGPGVMEGANRGAWECGRVSGGFNIQLPQEQRPNPFITPGLALRFRYFALRKLHFMMRARALVAFPGGFGTLDELFEALTLVQTGKIAPIPIVLVGRDFWSRAVDFDFLEDQGLIGADDRARYTIVDSGAEAAAIIQQHHATAAP